MGHETMIEPKQAAFLLVLAALIVPSCLHSSAPSPAAASLLDLRIRFPNQAFRMCQSMVIPTETLAVKFDHLNAAIRKQHPSITAGPIFPSARLAASQVQGWTKQYSTSTPLSECTLRAFLRLHADAFQFTFREEENRIVIDTGNAPTTESNATSGKPR